MKLELTADYLSVKLETLPSLVVFEGNKIYIQRPLKLIN